MPRLSARMFADASLGAYTAHGERVARRAETAALIASALAADTGVQRIRGAMQAAGLGRLGNGIGATSDMQKGRGVHRSGAGYSASGAIFVRSGSERTRGAIEAYTRGAEILPRRGRWLWIPTDEIPRVTGRYRMTPELYRKNGFEQKIGPLVFIRSINGNPLLVAKNVGVSEAGKRRSAKSLTKAGRPRKGQRVKEFVVAFVGIPRTARAARVDVEAIMRSVQADMPRIYAAALEATRP